MCNGFVIRFWSAGDLAELNELNSISAATRIRRFALGGGGGARRVSRNDERTGGRSERQNLIIIYYTSVCVCVRASVRERQVRHGNNV